jgi:hypothetical protein
MNLNTVFERNVVSFPRTRHAQCADALGRRCSMLLYFFPTWDRRLRLLADWTTIGAGNHFSRNQLPGFSRSQARAPSDSSFEEEP